MKKNTLIIGAGQAGAMVAEEIQTRTSIKTHYKVIGFLDDNAGIKEAYGYPVFGPVSSIGEVIRLREINLVIIAVPSATSAQINHIFDEIAGLSVTVKIVPGLEEIIKGDVHWRQIRKIKPVDLLGREEVGFDPAELSPSFNNAVVLVTGGGGSIGSEICRQLLNLPVKKVIALGHGENSIFKIKSELMGFSNFSCQISDIQDRNKLSKVITEENVTHVFHAAAHKHVPLMEDFPDEAVKNNIIGTSIVAELSLQFGVRKFVYISTDKAVNPSSVMGASKRIGERLVLGMNGEATKFIVTRFGNVLGSRGSVLPLFINQIEKGGPLTVTHRDMERYFMSIREAARLVIKAVTLDSGKLFILDMGSPRKIYDIAEKLIKLYGFTTDEIPIQITGLRPGEKMTEELLTFGENLKSTKFSKLSVSDQDDHALTRKRFDEFKNRFNLLYKAGEIKKIRDLVFEYAV